MELSLKQSPSMDGNQDPMQAQLALQQKQLEQQQALEKADLTKVQGQIENKVGNKLDQHSPEDQQILKKALAKEAVKVGGEDARIGGIGVHSETGKIIAQVGEFHHATIDPKATLEAAKQTTDSTAKLANSEASKTLEPERERSPALDKTPERDSSQALAKIDAKVEHKLDAYSPEEQQVLKQALAAEMVKIGGENAPISRIGVTEDGRIAVSNETHTAVIDARATLEEAHKEQASLVREQAAQELAQQNPEQAALEKHVDERYDHYMAPIQEEMKALNAIRNDYENFAALPEAERDALNDRMNELSSQRNALGDVYGLPVQEQVEYYAQRDQGESTPPIAEATVEIQQEQHSVPETALPQEQSNTPPVPEGTISEENLQRYADQGIEPVLESPPLNVPPLSPEEMVISDADMNRLNADLNAIGQESIALNSTANLNDEIAQLNAMIQQDLDPENINRLNQEAILVAANEPSYWDRFKETMSDAADTAVNIGGFIKDEGLNVLGDTVIATAETAMAVGSGAIMQPVSGLAGLASTPFVGLDRAATITKGVADFGTYKPQSEAMKTVAMSIAPITNEIASEYQQIYDSNVDYYGPGKTALMFGGVEALGTILGGSQALRAAKGMALKEAVSTTSTAETVAVVENVSVKAVVQNAEPLAESMSRGLNQASLSVDDFHNLRIKPVPELTTTEIMQLKTVRDSIPMPTENTMMQKVIPESDIQNYLNGKYKELGGYVARADDVVHIKGTSDIIESLRLDYPNTPFTNEGSYGVIRYKTPEPKNLEIPYGERFGGTNTDGLPCTLNGFSGCRNGEIVPEFKAVRGYPMDGAKLYQVTDGIEELRATFGIDKSTGNRMFIAEPKGE